MTDPQAVSLDALSPLALADLMLLEVLARGHGTLFFQPRAGQQVLLFDSGSATATLGRVSRPLAEAALARLALIAGLGLEPPRVGRIRVRLASHPGTPEAPAPEVLMSLRATSGGVSAELHALAGAHMGEELSAVAGIDGLRVPRPDAVKYEVLGELGRGGMGVVYLARHVALGKEVALKVLKPAMAHRRALAAQFLVEARAACRARHAAIVDVTDFGRLADGRDYLVMERVEWPTLTDLLAQGALPPRRALGIALEIAHGMAAAHRQGVVHRDLKPANVFVSDDDRVKVGDFGLALTNDLEDEPAPLDGTVFGTLPYVAPEQAKGRTTDHRADLYAFGCILHELLTGRTPYQTDHSAEMLDMHESAPIPDLTLLESAPPAALVDLHRRLLAKDPADRPASFEVVIEALEDLRGALP